MKLRFSLYILPLETIIDNFIISRSWFLNYHRAALKPILDFNSELNQLGTNHLYPTELGGNSSLARRLAGEIIFWNLHKAVCDGAEGEIVWTVKLI